MFTNYSNLFVHLWSKRKALITNKSRSTFFDDTFSIETHYGHPQYIPQQQATQSARAKGRGND